MSSDRTRGKPRRAIVRNPPLLFVQSRSGERRSSLSGRVQLASCSYERVEPASLDLYGRLGSPTIRAGVIAEKRHVQCDVARPVVTRGYQQAKRLPFHRPFPPPPALSQPREEFIEMQLLAAMSLVK